MSLDQIELSNEIDASLVAKLANFIMTEVDTVFNMKDIFGQISDNNDKASYLASIQGKEVLLVFVSKDGSAIHISDQNSDFGEYSASTSQNEYSYAFLKFVYKDEVEKESFVKDINIYRNEDETIHISNKKSIIKDPYPLGG